MGTPITFGCRPWLQNIACLVPQIGFVPPAGIPLRINWQPQSICISRKCLSHVLNKPLGYVPTLQDSLAFEVNLRTAHKFERR